MASSQVLSRPRRWTLLPAVAGLTLSACGPTYVPSGLAANSFAPMPSPAEAGRRAGEIAAEQGAREMARANAEADWSREAIRSGQRRRVTVAQAQTTVRAMMRDPESVRFRAVAAVADTGAVCGFYNARNAYGGYVGEQPFVVFHTPEADPMVLTQRRNPLTGLAWQAQCRRRDW